MSNDILRAALKPILNFTRFPAFASLPDNFIITKGSSIAGPQLTAGNIRRICIAASEATESRGMAKGCCSAILPCGHQQRDPYSICDVCTRAAGAGPVGEAVAALAKKYCEGFCKDSGRPGVFDDCTGCEIAKLSAARPVEEPGEVERFDFNAHGLKVDLARETRRAETAEAALAETQKRLEKLLAAVGKARTALAGFTSADDAAFAIDVVVGEVADWKRRAALTGDAQEAGPYVADPTRYPG